MEASAGPKQTFNSGSALLPIGAVLALSPWFSSATGLLTGLGLALVFGNPYLGRTRKLTHPLLSLSVMGLGAGMNLHTVARTGAHGFVYTLVGISLTFALGYLFQRLLKTSRDVSLLITAGTAICGGSAIAALAPTIRARTQDVSVALGTVFILNAVALVIFPWVGHQLGLNENQFGLWSALAIHDTSSVVGATLQYGARALEIGTTVKLTRALWIVPVTLVIGALKIRRLRTEDTSAASGAVAVGPRPPAKRPWFILGFLIAAALVTFFPALQGPGHWVELAAKHLLVLTLFLIGANLTRETARSVGMRPMLLGIGLWVIVATTTLGAVLAGLIQ
jgi:uncharacterized integral membrane protein (TIGR00698 family)